MVSLEFPEEKEKSHLSTSIRQGSIALRVKAAADPFLRTGQPEGRQVGWVGLLSTQTQQEMGRGSISCHLGSLFHCVAKIQ